MNPKQAEKMYKMLANRRRLAIIKFLAKRSKATVSQVAAEINLSFKATSKHLLLLKNAGLIDSQQLALERHYYLESKNNPFIKHVLSIL